MKKNEFNQAYTDLDIRNAVEDIRPMEKKEFKKLEKTPDQELIDMYLHNLDVSECASAFGLTMGQAIDKLKDFGVL